MVESTLPKRKSPKFGNKDKVVEKEKEVIKDNNKGKEKEKTPLSQVVMKKDHQKGILRLVGMVKWILDQGLVHQRKY